MNNQFVILKQRSLLIGCLVLLHWVALFVQPLWSSTTVEQPTRTFGYVLGDRLVQRVNLTSSGVFELAEPLPLGRIGLWLERQSVTSTKDAANESWLNIQYQIINAPVAVSNDELPALLLLGKNGEQLEIPAAPYSLGPITSEQGAPTAALPLMQPDRAPAADDTKGNKRLMHQYVLALLATLLAWAAWWYWREQKDQTRLPFAAAWHQIQQQGKSDTDQRPEAWVAIHDALNRYGGKTVQHASLHELIEEHTWMAPLQNQLDIFFEASSGLFFEHPARADNFPLHELSYDLYQAEKRNAA